MQRPAAQKTFVLDQVLVASTSDNQLHRLRLSSETAATQKLCSPTNRGFDAESADADAHVLVDQFVDRAPSANQGLNHLIQHNRAQADSASPLLRAAGTVATSFSQPLV